MLPLLVLLVFLIVPAYGQSAGETLDIEIYSSSQPLPFGPPAREIFLGLLYQIQTSPIVIFLATAIVVLCLLIALHGKIRNSLWLFLNFSVASFMSALVSLKVSEGWDEFFFNLRHSYVLSEFGRYSANIRSMNEGTVDFLPFFITGLLGKLSFPLPETMLTISLLGNVGVIISVFLIARRLTGDDVSSMIFASGAGMFPCVVFVGGTGFTATVFTAAIYFSFYLLFFREHRSPWGIAILAGLTLIRVEGVLVAFLVWVYLYLLIPYKSFFDARTRFRSIQAAFVYGLVLSLPFLISLIVRKAVFAFSIPVAVAYKNTNFDHSFFAYGISALATSIRIFGLHTLFALVLPSALFLMYRKKIQGHLIAGVVILCFFCFVYFTSGGDWFPYYWNRYMMPFTVYAYVMGWCLVWIFFKEWVQAKPSLILAAILLVTAPLISGRYIEPAAVKANEQNAFKTLLDAIEAPQWRWERLDRLGYFGRYLNSTTPSGTRIGSPELATIMYFAKRDIVDLMGLVNPEVALAPLNPLRESGIIAHRRRAPQTLIQNRAGILAAYEMVRFIDDEGHDPANLKSRVVADFLNQNFMPHYLTAYYRFGSMEFLRELGYRYLLVYTPQAYFNYFVHQSIYDVHVEKIKSLGFELIGIEKFKLSPFNKDVTDRFESGLEYLK